MSRLEDETTITWNDAEPNAIINTRSQTTVRRLTKKGYVFREIPPNSGLWRTEAPKRRCLPRPIVSKTPRKKGVPTKFRPSQEGPE